MHKKVEHRKVKRLSRFHAFKYVRASSVLFYTKKTNKIFVVLYFREC
jgi:hypothetical protein